MTVPFITECPDCGNRNLLTRDGGGFHHYICRPCGKLLGFDKIEKPTIEEAVQKLRREQPCQT